MRVVATMLWLLLCLLLRATALRADEEAVEQWQLWLIEALDLREAQAEELALLPWIDMGLAEAIIGLRAAGGLRSIGDLSRVPGMDDDRIAAIQPFIRLDAPRPPPRLRWEFVGAMREGSVPALRSRAWGESGPWEVGVQGNQWNGGQARAALAWSGRHLRWVVGRVSVRGAWPLFVADPALRSRTAPPPLGRETRLGPRLSLTLPAWWGGGVEWSTNSWRALAVMGREDGDPQLKAHLDLEHRWAGPLAPRLGIALRESGAAGAWFAFAGEGFAGRAELVRPASPPGLALVSQSEMRGSAAFEWRRASSSFGLAFTQSQSAAVAQDPITAQILDREHRAVQWYGSLRRGGWSFHGLARSLARGRAGELASLLRWQIEASGPWSRARLGIRLRVDEEVAEANRWRLAIDWREAATPGGWGRGIALRRVVTGSSGSLLMAIHLERGQIWFARLAFAAASGELSSQWAVGLPTVGLSSAWLAPGEMGLLLALGHRAPRTGVCVWVRWEAGGIPASSWAGGLGLRMRWGGGE